MINKSDNELAELLGVSRVTITRWRNQARLPNFAEVLEYEEKLGLPFECFMSREPNLESIKDNLELQLKAVKKLMREKEQMTVNKLMLQG